MSSLPAVNEDTLKEFMTEFNQQFAELLSAKFRIIGTPFDEDGRTWFAVTADSEVRDWLLETFVGGVDYGFGRDKHGVFDVIYVTEEVLVMLKLKWM